MSQAALSTSAAFLRQPSLSYQLSSAHQVSNLTQTALAHLHSMDLQETAHALPRAQTLPAICPQFLLPRVTAHATTTLLEARPLNSAAAVLPRHWPTQLPLLRPQSAMLTSLPLRAASAAQSLTQHLSSMWMRATAQQRQETLPRQEPTLSTLICLNAHAWTRQSPDSLTKLSAHAVSPTHLLQCARNSQWPTAVS